MKTVRLLALPALLLCAGCFPSALGLTESKPVVTPAPVATAPSPPVTAERVSNTNARQMADALANELDKVENQE